MRGASSATTRPERFAPPPSRQRTPPRRVRPRVRPRDADTLGPRVLLVVLDSGPDDEHGSFWEYVSDVVIRFDRTYEADYMVRTVEVKKARHQAHVWGVHQLKLYTGSRQPEEQQPHELRRLHPFRAEGGVFIYPSIHFYLSSYKRAAPVASASSASKSRIDHTAMPSARTASSAESNWASSSGGTPSSVL